MNSLIPPFFIEQSRALWASRREDMRPVRVSRAVQVQLLRVPWRRRKLYLPSLLLRDISIRHHLILHKHFRLVLPHPNSPSSLQRQLKLLWGVRRLHRWERQRKWQWEWQRQLHRRAERSLHHPFRHWHRLCTSPRLCRQLGQPLSKLLPAPQHQQNRSFSRDSPSVQQHKDNSTEHRRGVRLHLTRKSVLHI